MIFTSRRDSEHCQERQIVDKATEWLLSLEDRDGTARRDRAGQQKRFLHWLKRSPEHIRVFLEISRAYHALSAVDRRELVGNGKPVWFGAKPGKVVNLRSEPPPNERWLLEIGSVSQPAGRRSRWLVAGA